MFLHGKRSNIAWRPQRRMCPVVSAGKEKNIFFKSRCKNLLFNFESFLTLKGPSFSDFGTARRRGVESAVICNLLFEDQ